MSALDAFLRTRTRPFPLPREAVLVLGHFTIQRLVQQDGFATLDEWYDARVNDTDDKAKGGCLSVLGGRDANGESRPLEFLYIVC